MNNDKKLIVPDAELLSAMESLKVYGGKGNTADPQDTYQGCTINNHNCNCILLPDSVTKCEKA